MFNSNQQQNKSPHSPMPVMSPIYGQPMMMMQQQPQPVMSPQPMYYYQQQPQPVMSPIQVYQQQEEEPFSVYNYAPFWVGFVPTVILVVVIDTAVQNPLYWIASAFALTWAILLLWVARCRCVNAGWSSFLIVLTVITLAVVMIGDYFVMSTVASKNMGLAVSGLVLTGLMIVSMMTASIMTFFYK